MAPIKSQSLRATGNTNKVQRTNCQLIATHVNVMESGTLPGSSILCWQGSNASFVTGSRTFRRLTAKKAYDKMVEAFDKSPRACFRCNNPIGNTVEACGCVHVICIV